MVCFSSLSVLPQRECAFTSQVALMIKTYCSTTTVCSLSLCALLAFVGWTALGTSDAQDKVGPKPPIAEFEEYLSNSVLTGVFTIDGKPLTNQELSDTKSKKAKKNRGLRLPMGDNHPDQIRR